MAVFIPAMFVVDFAQVYAAAKSLLTSSKLPIKMSGVALATSLYLAEGSRAEEDLKLDDMELRTRSQVLCMYGYRFTSDYASIS